MKFIFFSEFSWNENMVAQVFGLQEEMMAGSGECVGVLIADGDIKSHEDGAMSPVFIFSFVYIKVT